MTPWTQKYIFLYIVNACRQIYVADVPSETALRNRALCKGLFIFLHVASSLGH